MPPNRGALGAEGCVKEYGLALSGARGPTGLMAVEPADMDEAVV